MPVLLIFSSIWGNDRVHLPWMDFEFSCSFSMRAQNSLVFCTVYLGGDVEVCMGGAIVAKLLAIRLCSFRHLLMVLYMCTSGTMHVLTS